MRFIIGAAARSVRVLLAATRPPPPKAPARQARPPLRAARPRDKR
jgi:hypothetical protein